MKRFFSAIWFCVRWGLFIGVVLTAIGVVCALQQLNTQIKLHVLREFQKRFPELCVEISSVELAESKGITIRQLELSLPSSPGLPERPILIAEELFIECPVTLQAFFNKTFACRRLIIKNPIIKLTRNENGQFEELRYFKQKKESESPCPVNIQNGTLLYDDLTDHVFEPVKISGLDITLTPPRPMDANSVIDLNNPTPTHWTMTAKGKSDFLRQLTASGNFDPETGNWGVSGKIVSLDCPGNLLAFVPQNQTLRLDERKRKTINSFQGRFDLNFSAVKDAQAPFGCRFAVDGTLAQGRADIDDLDRTLSEMSGKFRLTDDEFVLEKLTGIAEAARFVLSLRQEGLKQRRSTNLSINITGLAFDDAFVHAIYPLLNERTQILLNRFSNAGVTDLDAEIALVDGQWKPKHLNLRFADLAFTFHEFPYAVERLIGDLNIDAAGKIRFNLVTRHGEPTVVKVLGEYENVFVDPAGQVQIWGEDVPIDEKLMKTIPAQHRNIVQSLHPAGKIAAYLQLVLPPGDIPLQKHFSIALKKVAVQYEKFPYALREIDGWLQLDGDSWTFRNLVGTNESAAVKCNGHLKPLTLPNGSRDYEFLMGIEARGLPIDGQLNDAILDPNHREILAGIQAKGKVDLDAQVRFRTRESKLNLQFRAIPCPGLQITPKHFPYRIDNVQGTVYYNDGFLYAENFGGNNQDTRFNSNFRCRFSPDGSWTIQINPLMIDQLPANRELRDALPASLQTIFENLQLRKPVNIHGTAEFSKTNSLAPLRTSWNFGVRMHQNSMDFGTPVKNVFGTVQLSGISVENDMLLAGELKLDSVTMFDCQATDVVGPFFYDGRQKQIYIGQPALKTLPQPAAVSNPETQTILNAFRHSPWFVGAPAARPITGHVFDGAFISEGLALLGNGISYSISSDLIGVSLAQLVRELEPNARNVEGTLNARINLNGEGRKMETLGGGGRIQLRNANVYELPNMMKLLRELSIREVDQKSGAFSSADVDFRIQGNNVVLDPLIFDGSAFNLKGNGTMRLDTRTVDLIMKTRLGSRRAQIPIVSEVLGIAGDQIIQLSVQGPISDLTFTRIMVPEFRNAIQQNQGEEPVEEPEYIPKPKSGPSKLFPWR